MSVYRHIRIETTISERFVHGDNHRTRVVQRSRRMSIIECAPNDVPENEEKAGISEARGDLQAPNVEARGLVVLGKLASVVGFVGNLIRIAQFARLWFV